MKKKFKMQDVDCANCAAKMEDAIKKIDGVNDATISFMTQRLTIDADDDKFDEIMAKAQSRMAVLFIWMGNYWSSTVTMEAAGILTVSLPSLMRKSLNGTVLTASGFPNSLWSVRFFEASISPEPLEDPVTAPRSTVTSWLLSASRFDRETCTFPAPSREAVALSRGMVLVVLPLPPRTSLVAVFTSTGR